MPRIQRLPPDLANQIAAGEVVERPASVVKELVENALDAGARRIAVTIEYGGKRLVRVEDDGHGMDPEDVRLAVERHATSKVRRAEDLAAIATLGFRGEALPSIASVSRFTLRSRERGRDSGTEIRVNAGAVAGVVEVGMPEGTRIDVEDLFYNLPARRKFLKSDQAEASHVSRIVTQLALASHETGFTLTSAGRRLLDCPPASTLKERVYQLYGASDELLEVRREAGGIRIVGFIAPLAEQGPRRGPQNLFVNRRIVRDRTLAHAIAGAYSLASIKERSPEVHLFIEMPFDAVDVNVHPTKAEVRFRDQAFVHELVRRAMSDALGAGAAPAFSLTAPEPPVPAPRETTLPGAAGFGFRTSTPVWSPSPERSRSLEAEAPSPDPGQAAGPVGRPPTIRPLTPLGQFRDTFIIAVDDEGVAIVDQHVAHERILFERTMERLTKGRMESQRLLQPVIVELPSEARSALASRAADLERLGFEVEEFGGDAVRVGAVPALLGANEAIGVIRALAQDLEGLDRAAPMEEALRRLAATIACHAAVKANDRLTYEKMAHILDELSATAFSTVCPHGRPVMLRLTRREIEKNFQRI